MTIREFEIFVVRSRQRLIAIARHYVGNDDEAEDVVQEALIRLLSIRHRIAESGSIDALSSVVVKRLSLNVIRNRSRHPMVALNERLTIDEESITDERIKEVLRLIEKLPSKQQMILRLRHLEGMEVDEIASAVQMSHEAIYQNLSRARHTILELFKTRQLP